MAKCERCGGSGLTMAVVCGCCGEPPIRSSALLGSFPSDRKLCHVRMFKPEFAPKVLSGEKCQTIRPTPKRMPRTGHLISLRQWTGKPYRSKQRTLRESVISEVEPIRITEICIIIGTGDCSFPLNEQQAWELAKADGFNTLQDMLEWFNVMHGLPFEGILIKWHNSKS